MRGGRSVSSDRPTASQLLSLDPVAAFFTRDTSRLRSWLLRFQGLRPFRTMRAKSRRSLELSVSLTRSRAFCHSARPISHTTAHGTARTCVQRRMGEGIVCFGYPPPDSPCIGGGARAQVRPARSGVATFEVRVSEGLLPKPGAFERGSHVRVTADGCFSDQVAFQPQRAQIGPFQRALFANSPFPIQVSAKVGRSRPPQDSLLTEQLAREVSLVLVGQDKGSALGRNLEPV